MASSKVNLMVVIWGTLEIFLFGGLIFGWASLVYVLKSEGYFADICFAEISLDIAKTVAELKNRGNSSAHLNESTPLIKNPFLDTGAHQQSNYTKSAVNLDFNPLETNGNGPDLDNYKTGYNLSDIVKSNGCGKNENITTSKCQKRRKTTKKHYDIDHITCKKQDEEFNLVYTLAVVINGVTLFGSGWLLDRYGTRLCRIIGIVTYLLGTFLTAFSSAESSMLLYPSMILLSFGGYFFIMTNFQLGNLIPSKRSTIISLYCGAYDSSAFILVLVKFAYEAGIGIRASFLFLSFIFSIVIISTFWFQPKKRIPFPLPDNYAINLKCETPCGGSRKSTDLTSPHSKVNGESGDTHKQLMNGKDLEVEVLSDNSELPLTAPDLYEDEVPTFSSICRSKLYMTDVFWLTCHRFASWSYVGRLNPALSRLASNDKVVVGKYTSVYASLQFFGIFLAPLSGRLMDRRKGDQEKPSTRADKLEVCIASFVLDSSVGLLLAITTCIPVLEVQYLSFVLHVVHRACLYGPNSAFIAQAFPSLHFGKLFGFVMSFSAAFSLLQYPLFVLVQTQLDGDPLLANLFTLFLMIISYVHPVYIWWWCKQERQKHNAIRSAIYKPHNKNQEEASPLKQASTDA